MEGTCRWTSAATAVLLLVACASAPPPNSATSATSAPNVRLAARPVANPIVMTTLDVSLSNSSIAAPAAAAAARLIGRRIADCWEEPEESEAPAVVLQVALAEDGSVSGVETTDKKRFASEPSYRAAAAAATRALFQCAPYPLPASDFDVWNSLPLKLTPHHV